MNVTFCTPTTVKNVQISFKGGGGVKGTFFVKFVVFFSVCLLLKRMKIIKYFQLQLFPPRAYPGIASVKLYKGIFKIVRFFYGKESILTRSYSGKVSGICITIAAFICLLQLGLRGLWQLDPNASMHYWLRGSMGFKKY